MINSYCHLAAQLTKADRATVTVAAIFCDRNLLKVPVIVALPALAYCATMQLVLLVLFGIRLRNEAR